MRNFWVGLVLLISVMWLLGRLVGPPETATATAALPQPVPVQTPAPASAPALPAADTFNAIVYVTANSLNLRQAPTTDSAILGKFTRNQRLEAGERRDGWVLVRTGRLQGWVSQQYIASQMAPPPAQQAPRSTPRPGNTQPSQLAGGNCPSRRYCTQIGSCQEARLYLANCSWGWRLDGDSDGVPCESLCR